MQRERIPTTEGSPSKLQARCKRAIAGVKAGFRSLWAGGFETFKALRIQVKLSIIIGLMVVLVIVALSLVILQGEKKVVGEKVDEICKISVQNLSTAVRDNLLLQQYIPIQEAVTGMMKMKIGDLKYAYVIDRDGRIVSHSDMKQIGLSIADSLLVSIRKRRDMLIEERPDRYEYILPIFVTKKDSEGERKVFLGASHIGFSKKAISEPINEAAKLIFTFASVMIVVSILGVYFLAKRMSLQILALAKGAKQVGQGNLDIQIQLNTKDELGDLAREFNNMIVQLREKLQMQKFISQLAMQMIKKGADHNGLALGSERGHVTVFFSDARSFMAISEKLEPEALAGTINVYLELQARIIEKHHGIVDKFIGDQIMAIFQGENMADDALHAAIEIQKSISDLNRLRRQKNKEYLMVGIGMNLGLALMGSMGATTRMDYTVVGDTVNLAARLCSVAKPGQIIVPHELIIRLKEKYSMVKMDPLLIKGRSKPVRIYQVHYH